MQSDGAAPHPILNMTNVHMSIDAEERRPDDAAGNRLTKTALQQADPTPVSVVSEYSYDNIYQLTQTLVDQSLAESYTYDAVGNRLTSLDPASYIYNSSNQLTATSAATYTYDYNGNTLSKTDTNGTTYYTWDYENRLTQVTLPGEGGTVYFNYDPFGRRIRKSFGSATTIYAYDGDNVIEELDGSGSVLARYTQGAGIDEPLAMYRGLTTAYFHADGLGSITSLTDGVGQLSASYVYDSFGKLTASTGTLTNPFQYTSREFDSETGLYYYRARYYAPSVGRFLTEDPRLRVNPYRYVGNNPMRFVDPSGRDIAVAGTIADIATWVAARAYLMRDPEMAAIIHELEISPDVVTIELTHSDDPYSIDYYNDGRIVWNPGLASHCIGPGARGALSPAAILGHELAHAVRNEWWNFSDQIPTGDDYDNFEEKTVITGPEHHLMDLGEGVRYNHRGEFYPVPTVTSR